MQKRNRKKKKSKAKKKGKQIPKEMTLSLLSHSFINYKQFNTPSLKIQQMISYSHIPFILYKQILKNLMILDWISKSPLRITKDTNTV